ncbi:MAG: malate synthase A, partial [Arenimonas sp.]
MTLAQKQPPIPLPRIAHDPVPDPAGIPVLTAAVLDFLGELHARFEPARQQLLALREQQ